MTDANTNRNGNANTNINTTIIVYWQLPGPAWSGGGVGVKLAEKTLWLSPQRSQRLTDANTNTNTSTSTNTTHKHNYRFLCASENV